MRNEYEKMAEAYTKANRRARMVLSARWWVLGLGLVVALAGIGAQTRHQETKTALAPAVTGSADLTTLYQSQVKLDCGTFKCADHEGDFVRMVDASGAAVVRDGMYVYVPVELSGVPAGVVGVWEDPDSFTGYTFETQYDITSNTIGLDRARDALIGTTFLLIMVFTALLVWGEAAAEQRDHLKYEMEKTQRRAEATSY